MPDSTNRPLRVFLCHSSNDKPLVRELYQKLRAENWIHPWLDEEELYPGQDWNLEIEKAVEASDIIIVCLSKNSITKEGYVQRELRIVLDYADYKPEGTLYIIPMRLEECEPPRRLRPWQYADYFPEAQRKRAFERLLVSLKRRADSLGLEIIIPDNESKVAQEKELNGTLAWLNAHHTKYAKPIEEMKTDKLTLSNGMEFMRMPAGKFLMGSIKENKLAFADERPQHTVDIPYDYWMARFPVTNEQYNQYIIAKKLNHPVGNWTKKKNHPITRVSWNDAMAYCQWLNDLLEKELPSGLILRLPTEAEWEKTARGTNSSEWPWGNTFDKDKCNSKEGGKGTTTTVGSYSPKGDSPFGCADMAGNVWEWVHSSIRAYPYQANDGRENGKASNACVFRGGSWDSSRDGTRCAFRSRNEPDYFLNNLGFRLVCSPPFNHPIFM